MDAFVRYYDPVAGRFLSADPVLTDYNSSAHFNRYVYAENNPYKYIDPDGRDIRSVNSTDNKRIEGYINSRAGGTFKFDSNNTLQVVKAGRDYYSQRLKAGISAGAKIDVSIAKTFTTNSGQTTQVDRDHGGGLTYGRANGGDQKVVISGNSLVGLSDTTGKPLSDKPADILAHELVGHAIPHVVGRDTGNAVDNENKVRGERKTPLRKSEPNHNE